MAKTLIGVFDDKASAESAMRELQAKGVPQNHINVMANAEALADGRQEGSVMSWVERVDRWFNSLFESEEDRGTAHHYAEALRRGHYLVTADVEDPMVDRAVAVMNHNGAVDIQRRSEHWKDTGYTGTFDRAAPPYTPEQRARELATYQQKEGASRQSIDVVQEELAIGKRVVQRGGVRIHSYVEERPVEEVVRLREERINVQRVPVNRPAVAGDLPFQERTIDVMAMGEEPIVEKRARVVEEVVVGKDVEQRDQTIKETVRRRDVQIESLPAEAAAGPASATPKTSSRPSTKKEQPESRR